MPQTNTVLFEGSSKRFFAHDGDVLLMQFKDDIHGANRADAIEGTGALRKRFAYFFYRYLEQNGIKTHLAPSVEMREDGILVRRADPVKIEVLVRNVARGHWVDAHKVPIFPAGVVFEEPIVEFCLKMKEELPDGRLIDDPRINCAVAVALHTGAKDAAFRGHMIESVTEAEELEALARKVNELYRVFLAGHDWILEDFKFEVGVMPEDDGTRSFVLIDEISPDCSRIRDGDGNSITKDLFRQRKPHSEIFAAYETLANAIESSTKR
jgi:phosphoribosylaminoimidazole-succinocarboxamide synthase